MENINYKQKSEDLDQYIEEMHRMMNKASRRLAFMIEEDWPRDAQIECMKVCVELLQGESYEKYQERLQKVHELAMQMSQS